MASGNVVVKASTAGRLIPVEGATVFVVLPDEEGSDGILASRNTGRNGITGLINVETPEGELSLRPGSVPPFTTVDIRVEHPLYYPVYITGAQIFADTASVQNVTLIPLAVPTEKITENVTITPQNL